MNLSQPSGVAMMEASRPLTAAPTLAARPDEASRAVMLLRHTALGMLNITSVPSLLTTLHSSWTMP